MRVLVTGAAGFLGSHLSDRLLADGHDVIGVDNLSTGTLDNLSHLENNRRFTFVERDICLPFDVGSIDYVFNFASPASPPTYLRLPIDTLHAGAIGTENALRLAHQYNAGFLHASTSECYGDPQIHPQTESYWGHVNPTGPRSVYDESKRYAEALTMAYHRTYGVNTHLVRIFNTYGPRLSPGDGRIISNFMMQALMGEPLTVYGDGSQSRSFCYVSDLIDGIIRLSKSNEQLPVNIGNPTEFTVLECAKAVLECTGSTSDVIFKPLPEDDPTRRCPDIAKARKLLEWKPRISLREGLRKSQGYFVSQIKRSKATISAEGSAADANPSKLEVA